MDPTPGFNLVLWAPPRLSTEDERVAVVMRLINILREFHPAVSPQYERARSKRKARPFDYTPERVRALIHGGMTRSGDRVLSEFGSLFGFFSNMDDERMAGISFHVGCSDPAGLDSFDLSLPEKPSVLHKEPPFTPEGLWELFRQLVGAFQPFWGAVTNHVNWRRFHAAETRKGARDRRPATVHWMNYFGRPVLDAIGRARIERLPWAHAEPWGDGLLLLLQADPLDDANPAHVARQREVNLALGLPGR